MTNYALSGFTGAFAVTGNAANLLDESSILSDSISFVDDGGMLAGWRLSTSLSETLTLGDQQGTSKVFLETLTSVLFAYEAYSPLWLPGRTISDVLKIVPQISVNGTWSLSIEDELMLKDALGKSLSLILQSGISFNELMIVVRGVTILDQLLIKPRHVTTWIWQRALTDTIALSPLLRWAFGEVLTDTLMLSDSMVPVYQAVAALSEDLSLSDVLGNTLIWSVEENDSLTLADDISTQALYNLALKDKIAIRIAYISPGSKGDITTWAINTRTGAVTEYADFDFNSFGRMQSPGGDRYVAASKDGLYELDGPTDAGKPIISTMAGGLLQLAGSRFTSFKAAYLGLRGEGDFFFKLISGEGKVYVYKIKAHSLRTAKINLGKGLRSRYFTWQLESTGQDFDIDTIEFVPITSIRRV